MCANQFVAERAQNKRKRALSHRQQGELALNRYRVYLNGMFRGNLVREVVETLLV